MSDQPLFSKIDADRILKRAAEIEGSEETTSYSLSELRSVAVEAGLDPKAVDRAIGEARRAASRAMDPPPVRRAGFIVAHLSTVRTVPVDASAEQLVRAVRLFHPYREGPAQVRLEEEQITWRDRKGIGFTVRFGEGTTEIRVYVSKFLLRRGTWTGWVKAAADRLEALVFLAATENPLVGQPVPQLRIPPPDRGVSDPGGRGPRFRD
jgi:hypothetical protein